MLELYLRQSGFTCSFCWSFTKLQEITKKFIETSNLIYIFNNKLHKACFTNNAAYSDSKYLAKRTISDKIFEKRTYEIGRCSK